MAKKKKLKNNDKLIAVVLLLLLIGLGVWAINRNLSYKSRAQECPDGISTSGQTFKKEPCNFDCAGCPAGQAKYQRGGSACCSSSMIDGQCHPVAGGLCGGGGGGGKPTPSKPPGGGGGGGGGGAGKLRPTGSTTVVTPTPGGSDIQNQGLRECAQQCFKLGNNWKILLSCVMGCRAQIQ